MSGNETVFKVLISFAQIVASVPAIYLLQFPENFSYMVSLFGVVNLNFLESFSFDCLAGVNFYSELLAKTLAPLALSLVFALIYYAFRNKESVEWNEALLSRLNYGFLLLTYTVLPGVSSAIFRAFPCDEFDTGDKLLRADYSVDCESNEYKAFVLYGVIMIFVYPIGIPAFYGITLWKNRKEIDPILPLVLPSSLTHKSEEDPEKMLAVREEMKKIQDKSKKRMSDIDYVGEEGHYFKLEDQVYPRTNYHIVLKLLWRAKRTNLEAYAFLFEAYTPHAWWYELLGKRCENICYLIDN